MFQNLILKLREEDIRNITLLEKLTKMGANTEDAIFEILVKSAQGCVVGYDKIGSLNMVNRDIGSDDINNAIYTREIKLHVKPDLLNRLKSEAVVAA